MSESKTFIMPDGDSGLAAAINNLAQSKGIEPHSEEEQYIAGEVGQTMFKVAKRFMCDECRRQKKIFFRSFGIK